MLYPINPSLNKLIFLLKFCRFYNILAKIFNDLPFPCQDLQGSWQENVRSWQKNERSLKILARKWKILENHGKKMKDPPRSWQENERSLRISGRISKIFKDFPKVIMKILKRIIKGPHEDVAAMLPAVLCCSVLRKNSFCRVGKVLWAVNSLHISLSN